MTSHGNNGSGAAPGPSGNGLFFVTDDERTIAGVSPEICRALNSRPENLIGQRCPDVFNDCSLADSLCPCSPAATAAGSTPGRTPSCVATSISFPSEKPVGRTLRLMEYKPRPQPTAPPIPAPRPTSPPATVPPAAPADLRRQMDSTNRMTLMCQDVDQIVHDANNLLTIIAGSADLLLSGGSLLDDEQVLTDSLKTIRRAADDVRRTIAKAHDVFEPVHRPLSAVQLPALIDSVLPLVHQLIALRSADGRRTFSTEVDEILPLEVRGREVELREALLNLVINSIDAMPHGGRITLSAIKSGAHALISVTDTGTGMPPDVVRRCMEPHFTTKGGKGAGLGLAAVREILARHHGTVHVQSQPGKGTTITLRLPLYDAKGDAVVS